MDQILMVATLKLQFSKHEIRNQTKLITVEEFYLLLDLSTFPASPAAKS